MLRAFSACFSDQSAGSSHAVIFPVNMTAWPLQNPISVSCLLQRRQDFIALEVKAKENLSSHDFKGLKAMAGMKGLGRRLIVFLGERPFRTEDGIEALPIRSFLEELEARTV